MTKLFLQVSFIHQHQAAKTKSLNTSCVKMQKDTDPVEILSLILKRTLSVFFTGNPKGTSLGLLTGFVLHGIITLFKPSITSTSINIDAINLTWCICLGILLFNLFGKNE
ncbi:MAG: hypothetical protein D3910_07650 [Candidatus Electrothrix sp. ATG2]|nr:hypothetical protein [Candidatus Electrothrix sp. ATG2]